MAAPPTTIALGSDILFSLLDHLSPAQLLTIGRTCKTLLHASIKPLLRHRVTLSTSHQLRSFCTFILSDVPTRAPLVRSLSLLLTRADFAGSAADILLPEVLEHLTALDTLHISSASALFTALPNFPAAFSRLSTLRTLHITDMCMASYDAFHSSPSLLTSLSINCQVKEDEDAIGDIIYIVARHRSTLERLRARWCRVCPQNPNQTERAVVFPHMRALALREFGEIDLPTLLEAFPNLRSLELEEQKGWFEMRSAEELRVYNSGVHARGEWGELRYLRGPLDALYSFAFPSLRLECVEVDLGSSERDLKMLRVLVGDTNPARLVLRMGAGFECGRVGGLLDGPGAASIEYFVLSVGVGCLRGTEDELLEGIERLLSSHGSITFFVLRLDKRGPSAEDNDASTRPQWNVFDPKLQTDIARRLASASPSLRHLCLSVVGSPPRYWSVARVAGDETVLTELEFVVGRELVREAGLAERDRSWGCGIPDDM